MTRKKDMAEEKKPLLGMSLYELKEAVKQLGMPAFTGGQVAKWLYTQHVGDIDEMTNLSKANREKLPKRWLHLLVVRRRARVRWHCRRYHLPVLRQLRRGTRPALGRFLARSGDPV